MNSRTKAQPKASPNGAWRNRITGHGEEPPDKLAANPRNWRVHPKAQEEALAGVLDEVGWVQDVIVNRRTGFVVDGHLRTALALSRGEPTVPVVYVDLTPDEEALILATLDPLAGMAVAAKDALEALLGEVKAGNSAVQQLMSEIAADQGIIPPAFEPVGIEEQSRLDQKTPVTCPECGHEFTP